MSFNRKLMGVVAGASAVAVIGVAVAQGVMPDADIANPALGAGQQSTLGTSMGETGVPEWEKNVQTATVPAQVAPVAEAPPHDLDQRGRRRRGHRRGVGRGHLGSRPEHRRQQGGRARGAGASRHGEAELLRPWFRPPGVRGVPVTVAGSPLGVMASGAPP